MAGQAGRIIGLAIAMSLLFATAAAAPDPVATLAGRYSLGFENGAIGGERYHSENVAEIVPVDARHAYLRFSLAFYNGHSCDLAGVAERAGDRLIYRGPDDDRFGEGPSCRLEVRRADDKLVWNDGGSCKGHCGARGSFTNGDLPWRSRRPIRYMARLKASTEYRQALSEWYAR